MSGLGKVLVMVGLMLVAAGILLWSGVGKGWLGHLPGDIHYRSSRGHFAFYFPLATCLLLSLLLSLLLWLFKR